LFLFHQLLWLNSFACFNWVGNGFLKEVIEVLLEISVIALSLALFLDAALRGQVHFRVGGKGIFHLLIDALQL
jgi:hypothetical protein